MMSTVATVGRASLDGEGDFNAACSSSHLILPAILMGGFLSKKKLRWQSFLFIAHNLIINNETCLNMYHKCEIGANASSGFHCKTPPNIVRHLKIKASYPCIIICTSSCRCSCNLGERNVNFIMNIECVLQLVGSAVRSQQLQYAASIVPCFWIKIWMAIVRCSPERSNPNAVTKCCTACKTNSSTESTIHHSNIFTRVTGHGAIKCKHFCFLVCSNVRFAFTSNRNRNHSIYMNWSLNHSPNKWSQL